MYRPSSTSPSGAPLDFATNHTQLSTNYLGSRLFCKTYIRQVVYDHLLYIPSPRIRDSRSLGTIQAPVVPSSSISRLSFPFKPAVISSLIIHRPLRIAFVVASPGLVSHRCVLLHVSLASLVCSPLSPLDFLLCFRLPIHSPRHVTLRRPSPIPTPQSPISPVHKIRLATSAGPPHRS